MQKRNFWGGKNSLHIIPAFFKILLTFFLVNFAWIFFRMPTASDAIVFITRIFSDFSEQAILFKMSNTDKLFCLLAFLIWLVVELKWEYAKDKWLWLDKCWLKWGFYLFLFCLILTIGVLDASSFIYVSF